MDTIIQVLRNLQKNLNYVLIFNSLNGNLFYHRKDQFKNS